MVSLGVDAGLARNWLNSRRHGGAAPFSWSVRCIFLFGLLFAVLTFSAAPQTYKGEILGTVSDPNGTRVSGARLTLTDLTREKTLVAVSGDQGNYSIRQLEPGRYELSVISNGYRKTKISPVIVQVDQAVRLDIRLQLGPLEEQVIVLGDYAVIETETASRGTVISNKEMSEIPLNGRNYLDLALLSPGVVPAAAGANPHNINGSRSDHVGYLTDGVPSTNRRGAEPVAPPSLESIQEFRIVTNPFSAEYGGTGPAVISVALKSGGNRISGSVFEYHRNNALDARSFFDNADLKFIRNQFGAAVSGPIKAEKSFFLASYEGLRNRRGETRLTRVPTVEERNGVFRSLIKNPFTGQPFPNNTITPALISPVAKAILDRYPLPNREGLSNYAAVGTIVEDRDGYVFKLDHTLNARDQLSGKVLFNNGSGSNPFRSTPLPGFGSTRSSSRQLWALSFTSTFEDAVNEARFGITYDRFRERSVNEGMATSSEVGIQGAADGFGLSEILIAGFGSVGDATFLPDRWTDRGLSFADTLTFVRGSHSIRLGGEYQRTWLTNLFAAFAGGQIAFNGAFTRDPFADFLLGLPVQTQRQVGTNTSRLSSEYYGLFIQDDWQIHRNLTLNLGLRYDLAEPAVERDDRWANFIIERGELVAAGTSGYPRAMLKTPKGNFSPRVGFAWRPNGDSRTSVRAGYGIFRSLDLLFTQYQIMGASAFPFTRLEIYQPVAVGDPSLQVPFPDRPGITPGALNPNGWDFENPTPYSQNWHLTIAREISNDLGIEVSYVGSKGTHLSSTVNINQPVRSPSGTTYRFPGKGRVLFQSFGANSSYNALQVSVNRRFTNGVAFRTAFTWSKSIDNASFGSPSRLPQNPNDADAERGLSEFDRRRVWNSDFIYEIPFGRGRKWGTEWHGLTDAVFGGWQINGMIQLYDGRPFSVTVGKTNALQGFATRPDRIATGSLEDPTPERWFDTSAFVVVPANAFRFGNSGRNVLIGPGTVHVDMSVFKNFLLPWENQLIQFRTEVFNLPNRANFGQPEGRIDFPNAGSISSAGPGRQIQFALKYLF